MFRFYLTEDSDRNHGNETRTEHIEVKWFCVISLSRTTLSKILSEVENIHLQIKHCQEV